MADVAWTRLTSEAGVDFYTATITSSDTQTEILETRATDKITVNINPGASESLTLKTSTHPTPGTANMVDTQTAIAADASYSALGPIKGIQVTGASTNDSTIWVAVVAG